MSLGVKICPFPLTWALPQCSTAADQSREREETSELYDGLFYNIMASVPYLLYPLDAFGMSFSMQIVPLLGVQSPTDTVGV